MTAARVQMEIGVVLPTYRRLASRENIVKAAQMAEEAGFDSVWTSDHVAIPTSKEEFFGAVIYEPLMTLAYVAAVTSRVQLGVSVLVMPYRNPLLVAKMLSTLDELSNGRVILGAGVGWLPDEFAALGVRFDERAELTDESLQAVRACWDRDAPIFHGRHFHVDDVLFAPRPREPRQIPIWIGGNSPAALRRACHHGDGWMSDGQTLDEIDASIADLQRCRQARGGAPFTVALRTSLHISEYQPEPGDASIVRRAGPPPTANGRSSFRGTRDEVISDLRRAASIGINHIVFEFPVSRGEESLELFQPLAEVRHDAQV
jgi:probable F420-dependent oxidoreductase